MCKGVILGKNKVRNDLWLSEHVYIHTITRKNELSFTYLLANLFLVICGGTKKKDKKDKKDKKKPTTTTTTTTTKLSKQNFQKLKKI